MFPNFTGSSRKTRNVNLSGQRAINPFTNPSWSSTSPVGASKTVANAQAERQQRQRERDRLKAALRIQRSWRGHHVRRRLRSSRRQLLDQLYSGGGVEADHAVQRSITALPLLLSVYQASRPKDHQRLRWVTQDLVQTGLGAFTSGAIAPVRMNKLVRIITSALERLEPSSLSSDALLLLGAIDGILKLRVEALEAMLAQYYRTLGRCCHHIPQAPQSPDLVDLVKRLVVAPLIAHHAARSFTQAAYHEFTVCFLTQDDIALFEQNVGLYASSIDMDLLSEAILSSTPEHPKSPGPQSTSLWLLAHFVALYKAERVQMLHSRYLRTLYFLLCACSNNIREYFAPRGSQSSEDSPQDTLPPYVSESLTSLIRKEEISDLLRRFTTNHGEASSSDFEDASFLAGYILTLLYCFPALGDDVRMRLYLADISTRRGLLPAVKFFWGAMSRTSIFSTIATNEDAALDVLKSQRNSSQSETAGTDSKWHREWRTTLLFLELYVFVLRLADDDDFFGGLAPIPGASTGTRLRASMLSTEELKQLTLFLKHLSFTLYYNTPESLFATNGPADSKGILDDFLTYRPRRKDSTDAEDSYKPQTFTITAGIDFTAFRNLVSTGMKILYERDSRRSFLPEGHWLMTSKFDMNGFLSAVVLEEQKRHELQGDGEDEEDTDDEMDEDAPVAFTFAGQRRSRHAQIERLRAQQKKTARERIMAANGPKLEILRNMPFVIPFEIRVQIFRQFVYLDMDRRRGGNVDPDRWRLWVLNQHGGSFEPNTPGHNIIRLHSAQVTRGRTFVDAMEQFWDLGDRLKEPIQITFVDEFGMQEAGIDGGGVTKEFLTSVTQEAFTKDQRLFVPNSKNSYYPNPAALDQQKEALREAGILENSEAWQESVSQLLHQYEFLGRIIGKCMYEGILLNIVFAGFFLLKWASATSDMSRANINDLRELDEELYQGIVQLKNYPGDVSDLDLDFTITDPVSRPGEPVRTVTRNLIPNGENIPVTNENRPLYISYVARHRLMVQPYQQTRAFLRGLGMIIEPGWLSMFNQNELQRLVGGDNSEIDVEDLRRHTIYSGVYAIGDDGEEHETVKLFWEVMHGLEDEERREVLKYVTSTPRAPLLGFSQLRPPFSIRDGGGDEERLPSASTCVNLLKLPRYTTAETLRSKLLYAVKSGAGFDLS